MSGQVVNATIQQPIQGALIEIINAQEQVVATVRTDALGNFTIGGLAPGVYTIRVIAEGFISQTRQVTVAASEIVFERFELIPITPAPPFNPCDLINPVAACKVVNLVCKELRPSKRKTIQVLAKNGSYHFLQLIHLAITANVIITITGENGSCVSEPYQFVLHERIALYAPEGTKISSHVAITNCNAQLVCVPDEERVKVVVLSLEYNQHILSEVNAVIEVTGVAISPRQAHINYIGKGKSETMCIRASKVLDSVKIGKQREMQLNAEQILFTCENLETE
ncbi:carboxypeptidase regulatory-like domain-containing protein [Priestia megaterium]|nr:carboxypeptidase regulatory-like domain-containing protein [Priestia megaterium]